MVACPFRGFFWSIMCQLLGMNSNVPTDICFSFDGFRRRGGVTGEHKDGWGIAFFEEGGCRTFIDAHPACTSPIADLVKHYPIHSHHVIAHIRKATQGKIALRNCHPFTRELWGQYWMLAHNGDLKNFCPEFVGPYQPVGETDSERAFCYILQQLQQRCPYRPSLPLLLPVLAELVNTVAQYGVFNCLISNGDFLFAHCSDRLCYVVRQQPFPTAHLVDADLTIDFSAVTTAQDRVAVIATQALTDNESWLPLQPGEAVVFRDGEPIQKFLRGISPK